MRLLTLKSILLATDLDEATLPALLTAAHLATLAEARLHLLHVQDEERSASEARLRDHLEHAVPDGPEPATVRVLPGSPSQVIAERAATIGADAVILGPHRKANTNQGLGSTATSVVTTAPCPCLVAATELNLPLEHVVVPIDLSDVAAGALLVAVSWASALRPRGAQAKLTVLHVTPDSARAKAEPAVRAEIERAKKRASYAAQVEFGELLIAASDPAEEILRHPVSASADLLVMGTRGSARATGGLGSVSAAVAKAAFRPLLLVPPAIWQEQVAQ